MNDVGRRISPLLSVTGLSKTFPGLRALDDVRLQIHSGEIVAVVGHNGSGKSTLVKILAGVHQPDPGARIEVRNRAGERLSGQYGRGRLHFIHQDLGLLEMLSTVENLSLGQREGSRSILPARGRAERARAGKLIARFGAHFDVSAPVGSLSPAERAIVAIARALDGWQSADNVLVLDEPTTAFHQDEVERLFEAVRRVAQSGAGILFISHRLDEVLGLADRVVALRDGRIIADEPATSLDHRRIVELIAGRAIAEVDRTDHRRPGRPAMEVHGLCGEKLRDLKFSLAPGEVLGISGILGSGREEVAALLFGSRARAGGTVTLGRTLLPPADPTASIRGGIGYVPADRRRSGALMDMNVRENLTLPLMAPLKRRFGRLDGGAERAEAVRWAAIVGLRPPDPERPVRLLSGGNQQKVVLGKWLRTEPTVLLLEEPTQGVDIGAKAAIYELIDQAKRAGTGILLSSSETKELVALCDRVLVLEHGRVTAELSRAQLSEEWLVRAELGIVETQQRCNGSSRSEGLEVV